MGQGDGALIVDNEVSYNNAGQQIIPRSGHVFVGEPGAVLDGGGDTEFAFRGQAGIDEVTIEGLEIRNYAPPLQWGAVRAVGTNGWVVRYNNIHHNRSSRRRRRH